MEGRLPRNHMCGKSIVMDALQDLYKVHEFGHRHIRHNCTFHLIDELRQTRQNLRRYDFGKYSFHKFLLPSNASDIPLAVAVTHILNRLFSVHMLLAWGKIYDEPAVIVPRVFVMHALFHINIDAADHIDDTLKRLNVDDDIVIHRDAEKMLNTFL